MSFWNGLLFGMVLQLSVGPVCLAVLQRSVTLGFRQAWWMVAGVALVDAAYMAGAMGGLALFLQIPSVKQAVVIGGALTLVWFGIGSLRAKAVQVGIPQTAVAAQQANAAPLPSVAEAEKPVGRAWDSFWLGIALTMTNPLTIVFWAGVFGTLMSSSTFFGRTELFSFAAGCVLSTLLFLTAVSVLGTYVAKVLRPVWLHRMNKLVGLFLIGFAVVLLLQNAWSF